MIGKHRHRMLKQKGESLGRNRESNTSTRRRRQNHGGKAWQQKPILNLSLVTLFFFYWFVHNSFLQWICITVVIRWAILKNNCLAVLFSRLFLVAEVALRLLIVGDSSLPHRSSVHLGGTAVNLGQPSKWWLQWYNDIPESSWKDELHYVFSA